MGSAQPRGVNDAAVDAEIVRLQEERYVARYQADRTLKFYLSVVAFAVVLAALPLIPIVRGFLRVGPVTLGLALLTQVVIIGAATLAAHRPGGILGPAHRDLERFESIGVAAFAAFLIRASDTATSIFWLIAVMHALFGAQETLYAKWNHHAHGVCLALVGLSFAAQGRFGDAAAVFFFTVLLLFLAHSNYAAARREVRLQAERNVLLVENERQRIARDLHDGLGAGLASLAWTADGAVGDRARMLLGELREVVRGLKATDMQLAPFADALAASCRPLAKTCALDFRHDGDGLVRAEVCLELTLMVREAVRNAAEHAGAKRIAVALVGAPDAFEVLIEDDGRGLPEGAIEASKGGLSHLRRRAELLGGTLAFARPSTGGTRITIRVGQGTSTVS
jgi:signal transduction histidine kinase